MAGRVTTSKASKEFAPIPTDLIMNPDVTLGMLRVTHVLIQWAAFSKDRKRWIVWPSGATLAKETGMSERSVWRAIAELETLGVLYKSGIKQWSAIEYEPRSTVYVWQPTWCKKTKYRDEEVLEEASPYEEACNTPVTDDSSTLTSMSHQTPNYDTDVTVTMTRVSEETLTQMSDSTLTQMSYNKKDLQEQEENNIYIGNLNSDDQNSNDPESSSQETLFSEPSGEASGIEKLTTELLARATKTQITKMLPTYGKLPKGANGRITYPPAFLDIKAIYPKSSKPFNGKIAYEKWRAALASGLPVNDMLTAVQHFAHSVEGRQPKYVTTAANWFTRAQWEEFLEVEAEEEVSENAETLRVLFQRPWCTDDILEVAAQLDARGVEPSAIRNAHRAVSKTLSGVDWGPKALLAHWPEKLAPAKKNNCNRSCGACGAEYDPDGSYKTPACALAGNWETNAQHCDMIRVTPRVWRQKAERLEMGV